MSLKKVSRKDSKQISFFTSHQIHRSIKEAAFKRDKSIKDYLVSLHMAAQDSISTDNLIMETYNLVQQLARGEIAMTPPPISRSMLPTKLMAYIQGQSQPKTRSTLLKIFQALLALGSATHYQINDYMSYKSHNQPRALKKAVNDNIILVTKSEDTKIPYIYTINPTFTD